MPVMHMWMEAKQVSRVSWGNRRPLPRDCSEALKIQGRDALPRVRNAETQHGRGAPRPYQIGFVGRAEFFTPLGRGKRRQAPGWILVRETIPTPALRATPPTEGIFRAE